MPGPGLLCCGTRPEPGRGQGDSWLEHCPLPSGMGSLEAFWGSFGAPQTNASRAGGLRAAECQSDGDQHGPPHLSPRFHRHHRDH